MDSASFINSLSKGLASSSKSYASQRRVAMDEEEEKRLLETSRVAAEETKKKEKDSNLLASAGRFIEESNKAFFGGGLKAAAQGVNYVASGFNGEEADRRTKEFAKDLGIEDEKGLSNMEKYKGNGQFKTEEEEDAEVKENQTDTASIIGKGAGDLQRTAVDVATTVLPGVAAEKALRGTRAAQKLLQGNKGTKLATEAGLSVGGGLASTAAGAVKNPEETTGEDVALGVGIDAALGVAAPLIGRGVNAINQSRKAAKAAKETPVVEEAAVDPNRPFANITDEELETQLQTFADGGNRTADRAADYARQRDLLNESTARRTDAERQAFLANGLPNDIDGARKALEDLDNGVIPEAAYRTAQPINTVAEVTLREDMPVEIKDAAREVLEDRKAVEDQLYKLMSPERKAAEIQRLDFEYEQQLQALDQRFTRLNAIPGRGGNYSTPTGDPNIPGQAIPAQNATADYIRDPRYIEAKQIIDDQYTNDIAELDLLEAQDMEQVDQLYQINDMLDRRDAQITDDVNKLMQAAPDQFRDVDGVELQAQREALTENLAQAERFQDDVRVAQQVAETPDPIKTYENSPEAENAYKVEVSKQIDSMPDSDVIKKEFKNITGVKAAAMRVMSPSQVFESWGLRGDKIDLHTNILRAESAVNLANKADSEVLTEISKSLPDNPEAQRQIIEYLEGNRRTLSAFDAQAAERIRTFLDEKRAGLEKLGFKTLDDYFPHVFDKKNPEVQRLFKGKTTGEISFGNLKQRISDSDDYNRDIMDVLTAYTAGYNRKVHLEPALKPLSDLRTQVELQDAEAEWLDDYIKQLQGFDSSVVGNAFNRGIDAVYSKVGLGKFAGKDHYTSTLGTQRMLSAVATMGLNPGTAIRNLTQGVNTIAQIGPRYSLIGVVDGMRALRAGPNSPEWYELQRVGIMEGGVSQNYFDAITKPGVRGRINRGTDATVKTMMSLIRGTDIALRSQAYYGAKALGRKNGLEGEALESFAARKVIDSQFITSRVDMPVAFNGQGVRSLTQLATFSGKQAGFLQRTLVGKDGLIKNRDGTYSFSPKQAGSILSAVVTAAVGTEMLKQTMGFRESEWVPFYDQVAPIANGLFGTETDGGDSLYRSPLIRLLFGDGKNKTGLVQAIQGEGMDKFWQDNWSQIVPAGTQAKKTTEGFDTTSTGVSRNDQGNIRYLQNQGMEEPGVFGIDALKVPAELKATLFGQYSTEAGRNWINNGFPTLTEKQTATIDGLPDREQKEQYATFYQALKDIDFEVETADGKKTGRQAAYDEVKAAVEAGNVNRASRIAQEYNAAVNTSLERYWEQYEELPEDLRDEVISKRYININRLLKD